MAGYPFSDIEPKWQRFWAKHDTFRTPDDLDTSKPKYYVLDMFPYPSGSGLHVGHPEGYTATDILARYKRMRGFNVLHPMGWDAFGLPAEQYAIETGNHPKGKTAENIDRFREQLQMLGFSYDWKREVDTTDPKYVRWTQWIFLQLFKRGLAYVDEVPVNWCPELGTVLANEEIVDGVSERGGHPVIQQPMKQWVLNIRAYADRLLDDLDLVEWPESTRKMQENWIGKSEGANVDFTVVGFPHSPIEVFTTRPDTLFGATYVVLAPDHPLTDRITTKEQRNEVEAYVAKAQNKTDRERQENRDKTGVFTGALAYNPINDKLVPVWVADYVLASYGTGAIMAVPAHDQRDFDFATQFGLPIVEVVSGGEKDDEGKLTEAFVGEGVYVNSTMAAGSAYRSSRSNSTESRLLPKPRRRRLRGSTSRASAGARRRTACATGCLPVSATGASHFPSAGSTANRTPSQRVELPVELPPMDDFKPSGTYEGPLSKAADWLDTTIDGQPARRDTNTMPQWAGSSWYYLRYLDPHNDEQLVDPEKEAYWMPVDLYVGGTEHAVLHLLYARFWHKVLFDIGVVSTPEPFGRLVHQGMILGENGEKMSKSRGNVVNPDDVVRDYGADSLRLYEMFMGPLEQTKPWNMRGVDGVHRFLNRAWRLLTNDEGEVNVSDAEPTSRRTADPPPVHPESHRRHRRHALQHGDLGHDGVRQRRQQVGQRAAWGRSAVRAAAFAVCSAHRRGAVANAGPRREPGLRRMAHA